MSKPYARRFYNSQAWRETRAAAFARDHGLCVECRKRGEVTSGEIVHHIEPLTPTNINDAGVSLNLLNLETVCRPCHARLHGYTKSATREGFYFDADGNFCHVEELGQGLD